LVSAYRRYLSSADTPKFCDEVGRYYSTSTLNRLLAVGGIELRRAASLALGVLGDGESLEPLGRRLCDSDRGVRLAVDNALRGLLIRNAAPTHQHQLLQVMHLNDGGEFAAALPPALILTDQAPDYCEAHHQLAICWMGLGNLDAARAAYLDCLWRYRFHYPAWVGWAHCQLQKDQPTDQEVISGLKALHRALEICPDQESARMAIRRVERKLEAEWSDHLDPFDEFYAGGRFDDCEDPFWFDDDDTEFGGDSVR
jgi:hypothetical protein